MNYPYEGQNKPRRIMPNGYSIKVREGRVVLCHEGKEEHPYNTAAKLNAYEEVLYQVAVQSDIEPEEGISERLTLLQYLGIIGESPKNTAALIDYAALVLSKHASIFRLALQEQVESMEALDRADELAQAPTRCQSCSLIHGEPTYTADPLRDDSKG